LNASVPNNPFFHSTDGTTAKMAIVGRADGGTSAEVDDCATDAPHRPQNFAFGEIGAPHCSQNSWWIVVIS